MERSRRNKKRRITIKKDFQAIKTTPMMLRSQVHIKDEKSKWLDYSRRTRNEPRTDERSENNRTCENQDTLLALQSLGFDTSTTFADDVHQQPNKRRKQFQCQGFIANSNQYNNLFMVHLDRINNFLVHSERCSDQSIEEVEQTPYKAKIPSDYKKGNGFRATFHDYSHDGRTKSKNQQHNDYNREAKETESNRSGAVKIILNYYQKLEQFSDEENKDWRRHMCQFEILCKQYKTDDSTMINQFAQSLKPPSNAYHFYKKLRKAENPLKEMTEEFDSRCHSEMRRSTAVRSLWDLKFNNFRKYYKIFEKRFRKLISDLEILSCLAHDECYYALCTALFSAVERCPWSLHSKMIQL